MNHHKLTGRESTAINIMKAIAIFSVISAHVVSISNANFFSKIISSFWVLFGEIGVIIFFVLGGFLYSRSPHDSKPFWKKKFFRILVPWIVCSFLTYAFVAVLTHNFSGTDYAKWMLGSKTWYYYITIYTLFLFIFKWFYNQTKVLYFLIFVQCAALLLASFGISTTIPLDFFTDYLNPLHWIGYFSLGILIRRYRWDLTIRKQKYITVMAYILLPITFCFLYCREIFTYFHIISSLFCLSALVVAADIAYKTASATCAKYIAKIGGYSYCIYLLHMQIVQLPIAKIPDGILKLMFAPFIGLAIMLVFISVGLCLCKKIPFGETIKTIIGL